MQHLWTLTLTLMLVSATSPLVLAGTASDHYMTGGGAVYEPVGGTTAFACASAGEDPRTPELCDLDGDGARDLPWGVGAVELHNPAGPVQNVIVSISDDVYGSNAAVLACVYNPESDWTHCGPPDDIYAGPECGTVPLFGFPWASADVLVAVYSLFIADDLEFCGSSTGTVTADFF